MMLIPNVALQYEIGITLVQRELLAIQRVVKRNESAFIPSKAGFSQTSRLQDGPSELAALKVCRSSQSCRNDRNEDRSRFSNQCT